MDEVLQSLLGRLDALDLADTAAVLQFAADFANIEVSYATLAAAEIPQDILFALDNQPLSPHRLNDYMEHLSNSGRAIIKKYVAILQAIQVLFPKFSQQLLICLEANTDHIIIPALNIPIEALAEQTGYDVADFNETPSSFGEEDSIPTPASAEMTSLQLAVYLKDLQQQRNQALAQYQTLRELQHILPFLQIKDIPSHIKLSNKSMSKLLDVSYIIDREYAKGSETNKKMPLEAIKSFFNLMIDKLSSSTRNNDFPHPSVVMVGGEPSEEIANELTLEFQITLNSLQSNARHIIKDFRADYLSILQILTASTKNLNWAQKNRWQTLAKNLGNYAGFVEDNSKFTFATDLLALNSNEEYYQNLVNAICFLICNIESSKLQYLQTNLLPDDLDEFVSAARATLQALRFNKLETLQQIQLANLVIVVVNAISGQAWEQHGKDVVKKLNQVFSQHSQALKADTNAIQDNRRRKAGNKFVADMNVAFKREANVCHKLEMLNLVLTTHQALKKPDDHIEKAVIDAAACLKSHQYGKIILGSLEILLGVSIIAASLTSAVVTGGVASLPIAAGSVVGAICFYDGVKRINQGRNQTLQASASRLFSPCPTSRGDKDGAASSLLNLCPSNS